MRPELLAFWKTLERKNNNSTTILNLHFLTHSEGTLEEVVATLG